MSEPEIPEQPDEDDIEYVSRAELKREMLELQDLGRELVGLPVAVAAELPVGERTRAAIAEGRRLVPRALNRHLRFLAKLLAEEPLDAVRERLAAHKRPHQLGVAAFHQAERWRDRLVAGDFDAIEEILAAHPDGDRQHLRQLARNAQREAAKGGATGAAPKQARALFRAIAELQREGGQ